MTADSAGGVWTYALELARALRTRDVEVTLAISGPPLRPEQQAELVSAGVPADARPLKLEWMRDPWADLVQAGEWLLALGEELEPDVVHLNAFSQAALPWQAPRLVVGHSCVLSWFRAVRGCEAPPEWEAYAEAVRTGVAAADLVVAPTRAMLAELRRLYRPSCPARAIPNGRTPLGLPVHPADKDPFVLAAGRLWDDAKNAAALDRVAPSLPWPVLLAGAVDPDDAPHNATALGLLAPDALWSFLSRAAVFAAPARYEPFGYGPLEAALAGCALVLGDIPSLREVWRDDAVYVDPEDDDALRTALRLLTDDSGFRHELALRASERGRAYTADAMAVRYHDAYRALLAPTPLIEAA